ncbi:MAG: hypothetical protein Ta2G_03470 [Termitinemataceae bacterium]|nr:MAG: hypothetical protein Ta2G_03470 [Termitinemataceae bacterium]
MIRRKTVEFLWFIALFIYAFAYALVLYVKFGKQTVRLLAWLDERISFLDFDTIVRIFTIITFLFGVVLLHILERVIIKKFCPYHERF